MFHPINLLKATFLLSSCVLMINVHSSRITRSATGVNSSWMTDDDLAEQGKLKRSERSSELFFNNRSSSTRHHHKCSAVSYHSGSTVGHRTICPFDWVVDIDPNRIPEKIIEQVCQRCRSCGPHYSCTQLRIQYDVYYPNTNETLLLDFRAGCVCLARNAGSTLPATLLGI